MSRTFEDGKDEVARLAAYFSTNRASFHDQGFKEADARQLLIDPLFMALGWDVRNESRTAPQYREVIPEESLEVEGHRRAPDYTFRVGQTPKFYAEAKRPASNVKDDPGARLPTSPLFVERKAAVFDPDQFRAACGLRLPHPARRERQGRQGAHPVLHLRPVRRPLARDLGRVLPRGGVGRLVRPVRPVAARQAGHLRRWTSEFLKEIEGWRDVLGSEHRVAQSGHRVAAT